MNPRLISGISILFVLAAIRPVQGQGGYGGGSGGHMQSSAPKMQQPMQTPMQQTQKTTKEVVSTQLGAGDVTAGIQQYVEASSKRSADKKFHVKHEGQDLALSGLQVHDDRMAELGGGKYVACTNMHGADGKNYDIDFFLSGTPDKVKVNKTSVHKIDGNALYSWKKHGGVWQMSK